MKFLKKNSYLMFKIFGTQFAMSILGTMLYVAVADFALLVIIGTVCTVFTYWFLVYRTMWEEGAREGLRSKAEQTNFGPLSGTVIALIAGVLGILTAAVPLIFPLRLSETGEIANSFSKVCYLFSRFFFNGQYTGILQSVFPTLETMTTAERFANIKSQLPWTLVSVLPAIVAATSGYAIGLKNKSIAGIFGFDVNRKKRDNRPKLK